jgi:histidine ammonia-lyase
MLTQYVVASLVTENKILANSASLCSSPTSADQEDFVSMSANAAKKTITIRKNLSKIISVFYLLSVQAFELSDTKLSEYDKLIIGILRRKVKKLITDRECYKDIQQTSTIIENNLLLKNFEKKFKKINF